jgi:hypothetical protein
VLLAQAIALQFDAVGAVDDAIEDVRFGPEGTLQVQRAG